MLLSAYNISVTHSGTTKLAAKALINVQSDLKRCFFWQFLCDRNMARAKHVTRLTQEQKKKAQNSENL
jgi:hypothetical protein